MSSKRAMIAMSGGVDSSVAAYLTMQDGLDCTGVTMRLFDNEAIGIEQESTCCSLADVEDARSVCQKLGIPYYVFNFTDTFAEQVIERFITNYERGWTPNPCIDCNRFLKFERLLKRAHETNYDFVVTGHYARRDYDPSTGRYLLKRGLHRDKDQSYVLYGMTQEQLAHTLLPLGELTKEQVRDIARKQGFLTAEKDESQDICFVPDHDYGAFIRHYAGREFESGAIVNTQGEAIGTHEGIIDFTVGQRKGIGIAAAHPLYVTEIIPETATVVVGEERDLYRSTAIIEDVNLIALESVEGTLKATAKHRYRSIEKPVTVSAYGDDGKPSGEPGDESSDEPSGKPNKLKVVFDKPQKAITRGQALVLYDGDVVIGGGTIAEVL